MRKEDVSGSSGVGHVAEGAVFYDGRVVMRWFPGEVDAVSESRFDCVADLERIHGHSGKTFVEYIDPSQTDLSIGREKDSMSCMPTGTPHPKFALPAATAA